ncbi:PmeII family type II restriction endonuclease [Dickeya dadantii]|uniref:PmeII family type II restriction endonuclease n=1 Tax=Dickeya dadantii TaxID=204038 RepID=UPI000577BDE9|nr:PmeII family type II restriction endonuclease [Dickeya dadantii]
MIESVSVYNYIIDNIDKYYHKKREEKIISLKLSDITKRKNPYLFRAKGIYSASDLIRSIMDATLSSGEETIFGNFMEKVAIFTCSESMGGKKSSAVGIDLEAERNNLRYLISIKSGPNWGNASQRKKLQDNFLKAKKILATSGGMLSSSVTCIEGCCYGYDANIDKGNHIRLCGQDFWFFLSDGNKDLYQDIIIPIGEKAKEKNEKLTEIVNAKLNLFTIEFIQKFCKKDGSIDWKEFISINSSSRSNYIKPNNSDF